MPALTPDQRARYARHLLLPEVGDAGQERLLAASVLVVGAGGLGSPALTYLAAAGVGRLTIVDDDVVDVSNLQRQVLYGTADVGAPKVERAADRLRALNPDVTVTTHRVRFTPRTGPDLLSGHHVVLDCADNYETRYAVSDACAALGIPDVWAAIGAFDGAISVFWRSAGPCYRCLHPNPPIPGTVPPASAVGVLGALPGTLGAMQAVEAIKVLTGAGTALIGRATYYSALDATWRTVEVHRNPRCPACGDTAPAPGADHPEKEPR